VPLVTDGLWRTAGRPADWFSWRRGLPGLVDSVLRDWQLKPDGYRGIGECALVLGVRTPDGLPAAVKFGWPHPESEHEHVALRLWNGDGAVRLIRADPARGVLLVERAGPDDLTTVSVQAACEVVAGLYPRLHRPATGQLTRLSALCAKWSAELAALAVDSSAPHRLIAQASSLAADLAADSGTDGRLLHGDLHYFNVLAAQREPWLAIDPKPLSGDPCFEVAPLLWNRWSEAVATGDIRNAVRSRMFHFIDAAGLDPDRVRDWVIVREMVNVLWAVRDSPTPGADDREWITRSVTIAKAVQG
jgi:streptomycin 6-kinase